MDAGDGWRLMETDTETAGEWRLVVVGRWRGPGGGGGGGRGTSVFLSIFTSRRMPRAQEGAARDGRWPDGDEAEADDDDTDDADADDAD